MAELFFEFVFRILFGVILFPLLVVVASPVIWIGSLFKAGSYWENVRGGYGKVFGLWGTIMDGL